MEYRANEKYLPEYLYDMEASNGRPAMFPVFQGGLSLPFSVPIVSPKTAQRGGRGDGAPPLFTGHSLFGNILSRVATSPTHLIMPSSTR